MFRAPHRKELSDVDIALAGIPMDLGVPISRPGTRQGPRAVRQWSLYKDLVHYLNESCPFDICNIIDWGDIQFTEDAYNLKSNLHAIYSAYLQLKKARLIPLTIGGEHTITYGVLKGITRDGQEPLGLIHLDSHSDTSTNFGGTRVSDATLIQCAAVDGFIDPERTIQIGLRGRGIPRADFSYDSGMRVVLVDELQEEGVSAIINEVRRVIGQGPCYLTIDTDVFDCSVMPGTTQPEPFGLTGTQVRDIVRG